MRPIQAALPLSRPEKIGHIPQEILSCSMDIGQEANLEVVLQEGEEPPAVGRKSAKQSRSKAKVRLILDTTLSMLNAGPADKITTNDIARNANISIGTLYQFFSKKEDIYYEIYRQWLEQTLNLLDEIDARFDGSEGLEAYADAVFESLSRDETINSRGHWQLRFAMSSSRDLADLERRHDQEVFHRIVASQRKFARKVTAEQARALARLQHNVAVACLSAAAEVNSGRERDILLKWCRKTLHLVYDVDKLDS
ncbi:TetR/AcrR family transcriptional regulator [Inquilinus sp. NPDC058860]|uniref:TetR/AcrR family transcriptional regulator n=1 Tax=Inquilinus sp. NPDC058860 TaxID=3346652 RepID=UPI00368DF952